MAKEKADSANSSDVGRAGYHKQAFGAPEKVNHLEPESYVGKQVGVGQAEPTSIHDIALHTQTGEIYSGDPAKHAHKNKAGMQAKMAGSSDPQPKSGK